MGMSVGTRNKERQRSPEIEDKERHRERETQRQREIKRGDIAITQHNIIFQCCAQLDSNKHFLMFLIPGSSGE